MTDKPTDEELYEMARLGPPPTGMFKSVSVSAGYFNQLEELRGAVLRKYKPSEPEPRAGAEAVCEKPPTDKELYEMANNARSACLNYSIGEFDRLRNLRDAVLKRFKPREPRVIERWAHIDDGGVISPIFLHKNNAKQQVEKWGGYVARVVATEVIDD